MAHVLHLSKHSSIEGKICLEVGSGWVLSHALVLYLLGAKKVIATDVVPIAQPFTLRLALKDAIAYIPRDLLAPFSDHSSIRERYNKLLSVSEFNFDVLSELGIEYRSPVDYSVEKIKETVDFIYSVSVLEHVPVDDISSLLSNLAECLNPGGVMIHCIHLEDHADIIGDPFKFLDFPGNEFTRTLQSNRGNRIRSSKWKEYFDDLEGVDTEFIYSYSRLEKPLPNVIDSSISYIDEDDLRVSHIGVCTRKSATLC
jgi:SAM-dependent methyltransferase